MATPIIEITGGQKKFGTFTALSDLNLSVADGELVTLLGPSGCGKTTLMRMIAGFEGLTGGSLKIAGVDMTRVPAEKRPVNMVFQRYALFPHLDVFENVAFGLKVKGMPKAEIRDRVNRMLEIVQLTDFSHRYIDQISGGQSQRVALARALVNEPKVLLLDEPLAALDLKIRQHMLVEMKRIHAQTGATFIYVTHDQDEAMILSDRVVLLEKGRIVQVDPPQKLYAQPKSLFAAKFLGETNFFTAKVEATAAGQVTARSGDGQTFTGPVDADLTPGQEVVVSIRPESLGFQPGAAGDGSMEGTVEDITFIGSRSFYRLRFAGGVTGRVQVQHNGRTTLPEKGQTARVYWDPARVVILPAA